MNRKKALLLFVGTILFLCTGCDGAPRITTDRLTVELLPAPESYKNYSQGVTTKEGYELLQAERLRLQNQCQADLDAIVVWYEEALKSASTEEDRKALFEEMLQRKTIVDAAYSQGVQNASHVAQPIKGVWSKLKVSIKITAYSDVPSLPAKLAIDVVYYDDTTSTIYGYTDLLTPGEYYETVEFGTMDYVKSISNLRVV